MLHRIELGHEETDIDIVLPQGQVIQLQYRLEAPSLDVCLPEATSVTNWIGDDMKPAPLNGRERNSHVHKAQQLVIDINPEFVYRPSNITRRQQMHSVDKMNREDVIRTIRREVPELGAIGCTNILFEFNLKSFSESNLNPLNSSRLQSLLAKIREVEPGQ